MGTESEIEILSFKLGIELHTLRSSMDWSLNASGVSVVDIETYEQQISGDLFKLHRLYYVPISALSNQTIH